MSILELMSSTLEKSAHTEGSRVYGVVVGIVRDNNDPKGLGRVKVDFPWLSENTDSTSSDEQEERSHSCWARIATFMAGKDRGAFFIPDIDDEVLVAFEHGDLNLPFVIGCLWNSEDTPPETVARRENNNVRAIHTRSGHKIVFDDNVSESSASIKIISQGGHSVVLDDADGTRGISLKTSSGHSLILDDENLNITIKDVSGSKLVLDSRGGNLIVDNSGNQKLRGEKIEIIVNGTAVIRSNAGITLDSTKVNLGTGASMALVNEAFLSCFNTHVHTGNMGAPTTPPVVPAVSTVHSTMFTKGA